MSASITVTGIQKCIRAQYTNSLGWLPGIAVVDILPQATIPYGIVGLAISDGTNGIHLLDCRIDRARNIQTKRGFVTRLWMKDRRWRWLGLGEISGTYNLPRQDMTLTPGTEKTPQQLMGLVLDALGETIYSVSDMPNAHRPFVSWELAVPAVAGNDLLEECGCEISFNPVTNTVSVVRLGTGLLPAFTKVQSYSAGIDLGELPSAIKAVAGRTTFQAKLKYRPLAIDRDQSVVLAADAAYAPVGGWTDEDDFENLLTGEDLTDQSLANESVARLWGPVSFSDNSLNLPGYGTIDSIERILPLRDTLNDAWLSDEGYEHEGVPYLTGVTAVPSELVPLENTTHKRIDESFTLDHETGLVKTSRPLFKLHATDGIDFADVFLVSSMYLRNSALQYHRWYRQRSIVNGPSSPVLVIRVEDTHLQYTAVYDTDQVTVLSVNDNQTEVDARLDEVLDAVEASFAASAASQTVLSGIHPLSTNGLIRQVSYFASIRNSDEENCVQTIVHINTESEPGMPLRRDRRRRLLSQELQRQVRQWQHDRLRERLRRRR